jgi:hypothetical protein
LLSKNFSLKSIVSDTVVAFLGRSDMPTVIRFYTVY